MGGIPTRTGRVSRPRVLACGLQRSRVLACGLQPVAQHSEPRAACVIQKKNHQIEPGCPE
eukprot:148910-Prymnesium_polylepis.1